MATSTPTSPLLSPIPPPPPILPQKSSSQSQPKQNEPDPLLKSQPKFELSPQTLNLLKHKKHEQGKKLQQFKLELLVPFHIPIPCHANVSSMVALLKHFDTNDDDNTTKDKKSDKSLSSSSSSSFPTDYKVHKVPPVVNQLKGIQSKCQVYQQKAKEFHQKAKEAEQLMEQYKQLLQQQHQHQQEEEESQKQQQQSPSSNDNNSIHPKTLSLSKIETQIHQSKKLQQIQNQTNEYKRRYKVQQINYRYCLAHSSCPIRTEQLHQCWNRISPREVQFLAQRRQLGLICKVEKKAVENCCGGLVQSVISSSME